MGTSDRDKMTVPPGTRFGRYEVITEIASGGMATVYLGRALGAAGFQRLVAIKVLHPHVAHDDDFVSMFMDEARLAARIRHPNVVPTLDLENGTDGLFLVMEFVEGDSLLGLLRSAHRAQTRIPVPVVLRIVLDVLQGLHAAHELTGDRGEPLRLVHRDVSPHNILVGVDGIARITDFGIARAEERLGVTREGQVKGKLAYMAPEQTTGKPVDRRADLFSTGVVLWECLTGRRLFHGQTDGEVLHNLLDKPIPRLREVVPELPSELDTVCAKALSRDPDERFQTAAQFADALEEAGGAVGIGSARAVAKYVREVSGEKIDALSRQVRTVLGESLPPDPMRSSSRPRKETDPDRTVRRSDPPQTVQPIPSPVESSTVPSIVRSDSSPPGGAVHIARWSRAHIVSILTAFALAMGLASVGTVALLWWHRPSPPRIGRPIVVGAGSGRNETVTLSPALVPVAPSVGMPTSNVPSVEAGVVLSSGFSPVDAAAPVASSDSVEPPGKAPSRSVTRIRSRAHSTTSTGNATTSTTTTSPTNRPTTPEEYNPEAM